MEHRTRIDLAAPVVPGDHMLGALHAPVSVVEYGDFECPTCKQAAPAVRLLLERFPNRVCVVFRHFPLEAAHPHAFQAAEAAECASGQGKFWPMHDALFEHQSHLGARDLHRYAEQLGLDMARFTAEMDDEVHRQRVREHIASGVASHVKATPGFFVNGRILDVSFGIHALSESIERMLPQQR